MPTAPSNASRVRVLIAEPASLLARAITDALTHTGDLGGIGVVGDGTHVLQRVKDLRPDVLLLALDMPREDGARLLPKLMAQCPSPVIILANEGLPAGEVERLLEMGAVSVWVKPTLSQLMDRLATIADGLVPLVRRASRVKVVRILGGAGAEAPAPSSASRTDIRRDSLLQTTPLPVMPPALPPGVGWESGRIVAIGSSTGGPSALRVVLANLPASLALPIVIAQHIPGGFASDLVSHLDSVCAISVVEARDGDRLRPGTVFVSPGRSHMTVLPGARIALSPGRETPENCPSVDQLFISVAETFRDRALGVVLTGMGNDGARGAVALKSAGARVVAQDEGTSAVYGMPKEAMATGCVDAIVALPDMARHILSFATHPVRWAG